MATNNAPIVSIFNERESAERAIEDLYNAGIPSDQISYSGGSTPASNGGGFLDSIKNLFSVGHDRTSIDVLNDLNNMGIPQDEAEYYAQQYNAGRTIVAIQPETLDQNALTILRSNGGYDYQGNWNRASAGKFAAPTDNATTSNTASDAQNFNQSTVPTNDEADTYNNQVADTSTSPHRNFTGTEAGTYNQDTNTPAFTSQRRYADTTGIKDTNNSNREKTNPAYQQNPTDVYNQNSNIPDNTENQNYSDSTDIADAPTAINQQAYTDPTQQDLNNANRQAYASPASQNVNDPGQQTYADQNQQGFNNPNNVGQQAYINPNPNIQNFSNQNQQTYADPNQQTYNNPNNVSQQAYTDPASYNQDMNNPAYTNQQGYNNPNNGGQQAYTDSTQSANPYNQGINAQQNQQENPNAQRIRSDRDGVNRISDQEYEREQRNTTDQNNI